MSGYVNIANSIIIDNESKNVSLGLRSRDYRNLDESKQQYRLNTYGIQYDINFPEISETEWTENWTGYEPKLRNWLAANYAIWITECKNIDESTCCIMTEEFISRFYNIVIESAAIPFIEVDSPKKKFILPSLIKHQPVQKCDLVIQYIDGGFILTNQESFLKYFKTFDDPKLDIGTLSFLKIKSPYIGILLSLYQYYI